MLNRSHQKFAHITTVIHCRDVCKILLWSVKNILNHITANFGRISNSIEISLVGQGPDLCRQISSVGHNELIYWAPPQTLGVQGTGKHSGSVEFYNESVPQPVNWEISVTHLRCLKLLSSKELIKQHYHSPLLMPCQVYDVGRGLYLDA